MRNSLSRTGVGISLLMAGALAACGPAPPGTQYWRQAKRQYESGDYSDTLSYLNELLGNETGFSARASAWKLTILGAMTRAAIELEQACAEGIHRVPEWESRSYKTCIAQYRRQARGRLLVLVEALGEFEKATSTSETVSLDFPLPQAGFAVSSIVKRIQVGSMPTEEVFQAAVARTIDRQFILQAQDVVGAGETSQAVEAFKTLPVTVPKAVFLVGIARTLHAGAAVLGQGRLGNPSERSLVLKQARKCLQPALESHAPVQPEARALAKEIGIELQQ